MGSGTRLGAVRGLGSSKHGAQHWLTQRTTAVGNLLLVLWLILSFMRLPNLDYETIKLWLGAPLVAVPMILMLISLFWHVRLGLQVVIEDYVHDEALKFGTILALNFYTFGSAALGIFSVVKIALTGTPN
jgi:succinate dehydrogenase / fumarate reductase, membrane anchor subunit